mmetsp:Transcript_45331/g.112683  ORF Transcript_45331/g.112683 Transcript_45331/m.112683 type:complete len:281 (-) Transcript_45331:124-966(-)
MIMDRGHGGGLMQGLLLHAGSIHMPVDQTTWSSLARMRTNVGLTGYEYLKVIGEAEACGDVSHKVRRRVLVRHVVDAVQDGRHVPCALLEYVWEHPLHAAHEIPLLPRRSVASRELVVVVVQRLQQPHRGVPRAHLEHLPRLEEASERVEQRAHVLAAHVGGVQRAAGGEEGRAPRAAARAARPRGVREVSDSLAVRGGEPEPAQQIVEAARREGGELADRAKRVLVEGGAIQRLQPELREERGDRRRGDGARVGCFGQRRWIWRRGLCVERCGALEPWE